MPVNKHSPSSVSAPSPSDPREAPTVLSTTVRTTTPSERRAEARPSGDGVLTARSLAVRGAAAEAWANSLVGARVGGHYVIRAQLGEGAFGAVFLADQLREGSATVLRNAVIKVAKNPWAMSPVALERFEREAHVLARLNNHHLVTMYTHGLLEDGRLYLAMEYGGDRTLEQFLREEGPLPAARALSIVEQICDALAEAHANEVVHRDLKPANILMSRRFGHDWLKVVDLGIAKIVQQFSVVDDSPPTPTLTGVGTFVGTPPYASPEQCRGDPIDRRSDLYSVGVVLYELLAGRLPFQADSTMGFLVAHCNEEPPALDTLGVDVSPALAAFLSKALAKDKTRRFQTAAEMAIAAAACRAEQPRRARVWLSAGVAACLAVAGVWGTSRAFPRGQPVIAPAPVASRPAKVDGVAAPSPAPPNPIAIPSAPEPAAVAPASVPSLTITSAQATLHQVDGRPSKAMALDADGSLVLTDEADRWRIDVRYQRESDGVRVTIGTHPAAVISSPDDSQIYGPEVTFRVRHRPRRLRLESPRPALVLDLTLAYLSSN